jgi:hypothetical protein
MSAMSIPLHHLPRSVVTLAALSLLAFVQQELLAEVPEHRLRDGVLEISHVTADCPIIYDNDWWKDVPDAAYLWMKASQGQAKLRGNIVSRDMWNWQNGYQYSLEQSWQEAQALFDEARKSGLKNIPQPVPGAAAALQRPASGRIEETPFSPSPGSDLIVTEARAASPERPLLLFVGGPCTTVATAYLTDPRIAERVIVFQIDGGAYNGKDDWSWQIAQQRLKFVNWASGYFWGDWSHWQPATFDALPQNPLGDTLRRYARSGLGQANQWGDGVWIFWLFEPQVVTAIEQYDQTALTVPKAGTNVRAIEREFFHTFQTPP